MKKAICTHRQGTFAALCAQLNVSADYLLGLEDDPLTKASKEISDHE